MLSLQGKGRGQAARPLEELTLLGAGAGTVSVCDALGREYFAGPAGAEVRFRVAGALGFHTAAALDGAGRPLETLRFPVAAETEIADEGGEFADLLQILTATMLRFNEVGVTRWNGRLYRYFVCWLRDHVHTLKGMKYFYPELKSAIELYRDSQRDDGMIWDNVHPRSGPEPGGWDMRFGPGGFIRPFEDFTGEFKRIPVECDVEYLFVEGLYTTWKATGDDAWMAGVLDAAVRAMEYSVTSPYRWSEQYGLLKRGFTIDTWDFQDEEDARISTGGDPTLLAFGDAMVVRPEHTRFGVMFGDNTGYIASCGYLAEMLAHAGRREEAARYRRRAAEMKARLDALAWNGRHYLHHVPEGDVVRDLGVDQSRQVSLSNAYSLNRGLTQEQCAAIIGTYQELRDSLPPGSPGEWYTIYPPFERGFGKHNAKWQYMNGGVTPIVAGELAHGAFEHGFEEYGADILRRVLALGRASRGHLHCTYTGAFPEPPARSFTPLDLSAAANTDFAGAFRPGMENVPAVPKWTGEGDNDLSEMPTGRRTLAGIEFLIADPETNGRRGCIGLSERPFYRMSASVSVGGKAASLYLLHTISRLSSSLAGSVTFHYSDGMSATVDVVQGRHVTGWWMPEGHPNMPVAWRGKNPICANIGVVACGLDNPEPEKQITEIELNGPHGGGIWLVLGITLCDQPAWFPPSPVSYGIPDNWGAAAVVYALIEGLAGVKDEGVAFEPALLAPRWPAAGVESARATVTYPASGGYVAYEYRHDPVGKQLRLLAAGSGETCRCHVLLPAAAGDVLSVEAGGESICFTASAVEQSRYVDFVLAGPGPHSVAIGYA